MRIFGVLLAACAPLLATAQSVLNSTKGELGGSSPATQTPGVPVLQTILAVAVVIGLLKVVLPKLMPHLAKTKVQTSLGSSIQVQETATMASGQLMVVAVRGRTLLIGQTTGSMTLIADLTESEAKANEEPAFFELVDKAPGTMPAYAVIEEAAPAAKPIDRVAVANRLSRLQKLIGE